MTDREPPMAIFPNVVMTKPWRCPACGHTEAMGVTQGQKSWLRCHRCGNDDTPTAPAATANDILCWEWWTTTSNGHHRCMLRDQHDGPCQCCCGEEKTRP